MHLHDVAAYRKADAGAPTLGAALVEFLLDEGQFVFTNALSKVPDLHDGAAIFRPGGDPDPVAVLAVFTGVVDDVSALCLLRPL